MYSGNAVQGVEDGMHAKYVKYTVPQAASIADAVHKVSAIAEASCGRFACRLLYSITQPQTTAITGTKQMTHSLRGIEYSQQG